METGGTAVTRDAPTLILDDISEEAIDKMSEDIQRWKHQSAESDMRELRREVDEAKLSGDIGAQRDAQFQLATRLALHRGNEEAIEGIAMLQGLADAGHRELDCMLRAAAAQMELGNFAECRRMVGDLLDRAPTLEDGLALREIMVRTVRAHGVPGIALLTGAGLLVAGVLFGLVLWAEGDGDAPPGAGAARSGRVGRRGRGGRGASSGQRTGRPTLGGAGRGVRATAPPFSGASSGAAGSGGPRAGRSLRGIVDRLHE